MKIVSIIAIALSTLTAMAFAMYEASYVDSSGAHCASFSVGDHEFDLCHGKMSR